MNERADIVAKIRALLSKTVENGCSEHEALAALAKARAMMDVYEVTDEDLQLTKAEGAKLHREDKKDMHNIRYNLCWAIAKFTDTYAYRETKSGSLVFIGLRSDTELAMYLLDALQTFVCNELIKHMTEHPMPGRYTRRVINGFVEGCTYRISHRLLALKEESREKQTGLGTALIVAKESLIEEAKEKAGLKISKGKRSERRIDWSSYRAGKEAGDRATFGRPVGGNGTRLIEEQ